MNKKIALIEKGILILFILLMPSQLALHFWPSYSFVFGIRVDYLAPTLYLTDILALTLIGCWAFLDKAGLLGGISKVKKYLVFFLALATLNILFSTSPWVSFFKWLKFMETASIFLYFWRRGGVNEKVLSGALFYSLVFFSLIGIYQFFLGRTTGLFYLLGERSFNVGTPSIAPVSLMGRGFLRAYSTFPHPNAMAGYFGASLIFLFAKRFFRLGAKSTMGLPIILAGGVLTFSLGAFISILVVGILAFMVKNKTLLKNIISKIFFLAVLSSLILPLFSRGIFLKTLPLGEKASQRIDLSFIAGKMVSERFLIGEGLNTFIVNIPRFKGVSSYLWNLQPVHNIFLLTFAETGIIGLLFLILIFYKIFRRLSLRKGNRLILVYVFVVITGIFDHYWLTIQQDLLLFSLLTGLALR